MYHQLATHLVLTTGATDYSQPVAMGGEENTPQVDCVIFNISGSIQIVVQTSNDLENWSDAFTPIHADEADAAGYYFAPTAGGTTEKVTGAYVRLKYTQVTGSLAILAAGLNTTRQ